jgi:hypothetical protein
MRRPVRFQCSVEGLEGRKLLSDVGQSSAPPGYVSPALPAPAHYTPPDDPPPAAHTISPPPAPIGSASPASPPPGAVPLPGILHYTAYAPVSGGLTIA